MMDSHCISNSALSWAIFWMMMETEISLLRMVAGFLTPTAGEIFIGDKEVSRIPPNKRNVGMMFQSYALFPHMTVFENVAYGLKLKHMGQQEIKERVKSILQLMQIEGYAKRGLRVLCFASYHSNAVISMRFSLGFFSLFPDHENCLNEV